MEKTQLVQANIDYPMDATRVFNTATNNRIPIVLVPRERACTSCYYHIPFGVHTIVHNCGDDADKNGLGQPGLQLCKPYWNRVAYMVTQQSCTYNAPVKSCPTKDNVMVDCELTVVFNIGGAVESDEKEDTIMPTHEAVKGFVYKLGALKFNEFLSAEIDESIRQLVRATPLEEVYELRGSTSDHVQKVLITLNEKFNPFGVAFIKAAITDVVLNPELRKILQGTTEFRTKIKELEKEHDHNMKLIRFKYDQQKEEMDKNYDRRIQDIDAETNVFLANRERDVVNAESRREVEITKAKENASVKLKRAEANFRVVKIQAEQENEKLLAKIRAEAESHHIKVNRETQVSIKESEELVKIATSKAEALITEAKAEGNAAESLRVIRQHNLQMAQYEVTEAIARRSKMVISGDSGDRLLNSILDKTILGEIKLN